MTQDELIMLLYRERTKAISANPEILAMETSTYADKHTLINKLKTLPKDSEPTAPVDDMATIVAQSKSKGTNRKVGTCSSCNNLVNANDGHYYLNNIGKFAVHHRNGQCQAPAPVKPPLAVGFYLFSDDIDTDLYVKVKINKNTRRLNAEVLTKHGTLQYGNGVLKRLQNGNPVAIDEATFVSVVCLRKYGALPGTKELQEIAMRYAVAKANCIFCGLDLTDPRSNPTYGGVGYGPICAKKYNLPWGDVVLVDSNAMQTSPSPVTKETDDYL